MKKFAAALLCVWSFLPALGQQIAINRDNKTIAITADESASVDPEVATITVGYHNYAATKDSAYAENVRVSDELTKALLKAGIPMSAIQTETLKLQRPEAEDKWTADEKKQRQFEATQTWKIRTSTKDAQGAVDLAVGAGANILDDIEWDVADPKALQAKASAAALTKARAIAEQMAQGLNARLGDLIYASNRVPVGPFSGYTTLNTDMAVLAAAPPTPPPHLTLYPKKVKSDATVYAVFAIQ
jgi:uncharacterized protein